MTLTNQARPTAPNAERRNPALAAAQIRTRFYAAGHKDRHQIERIIQTLRVDPNHPLIGLLQMGKIPRHQLDNAIILAAETVLRPERRPENLADVLDINSDDLVERLFAARMLLEWSVDGDMVDKLARGMVGFIQWTMRPFRRQQMKNMYADETANDPLDQEYS